METKIKITLEGNKKIFAHFRGFSIETDQEEFEGGDNSAPTPFELFLASLGTCAGYYVASFCQARDIPTGNIGIEQTVFRNDDTHMVEKIALDIHLPPDFPEKYKNAVHKAVDTCTVKKHLLHPPDIEIRLKS